MPKKEKLLEEVKTPLPQRLVKELVTKLAKIKVLAAAVKTKTGRDLETPKSISSEPSS